MTTLLRTGPIRADAVAEGDYIEWPDDCGVLRRVDDVAPPQLDPENGHTYVMYVNSYDAHEYEFVDSQPVVVWRGQR